MVNDAFAQMDLFTYFSSQKITHLPGEFLSEKDVGKELSFEDLSKKEGNVVVADFSSNIHRILKAVKIQEIRNFADGDSDLLYDDGTDWPGCIHKKDYRNPLYPWGTKLYAFA